MINLKKVVNILTLVFSLPIFSITAQSNLDTLIASKILSEKRQISIHLPQSYEDSIGKSYPVIYTLDGDYTKFVVNGAVDFYSYLDKIPECIVVSINQNYLDSASNSYKRWNDCSYNRKTGLPNDKGARFKEFISTELIPFIDKTYRTTNFRTILGHSFTANFVNYFLLDGLPLFQGYIAVSPYYTDNSIDSIKQILTTIKTPVFYHVSYGENDLSGHIKSVDNFDKIISKIKNPNFRYKKFESENNQATHYTILPVSISSSIEHVFSLYSPINLREMKNVLKAPNKTTYLKNRYEDIEKVYGLSIELRESDITNVAYAAAKKKEWPDVKELGELTVLLYPNSFSGYYLLGGYEENRKDYEAALKYYNLGFEQLGSDITNIEDFQEDIDRVKKKIK